MVLAALFGVAAGGFAGAGYWFYLHEARAIRAEAYKDLKAIAELKMGQIVRWRDRLKTDALRNAANPYSVRWSAGG